VLWWQFLVTSGIALVAGLAIGGDAAVSALLGGLVMMVAGAVYAAMTGGDRIRSAGETLRALIRAEASKIGLIVLQLWVVLTAYEAVVPAVFIGAFIVAVLIYPVALLVRD
jgi:ATP synthase protein I